MTSLYDDPDLYDALLPIGQSCIDFYVELARQQAGDVLELACGSGLLLAPLAATGHPVTGLDSSAAMLDAARTRVPGATLVLSDMRSFALAQRFGLIVIARNSLQHLESSDDLIATLATARDHLAPGGVFAFDVFNPNLEMLARPPGQRTKLKTVMHDTLGEITLEQESNYDAAAQVQRATWFITTSAGTRSVPIHVRAIFPQELPLLVRAAGLELVERFGDYTRVLFDATSPRQVCIAKRAR